MAGRVVREAEFAGPDAEFPRFVASLVARGDRLLAGLDPRATVVWDAWLSAALDLAFEAAGLARRPVIVEILPGDRILIGEDVPC